MKIMGFLAMSLAISGCATQKLTYLADGSKGYSIDCSGQALSWNLCYEKAGKTCGVRGYDIMNKEGEATPSATATSQYAFSGAFVHRTLLVKCK